MSKNQVTRANRILSILKGTLNIARNHKKKSILLVVIISMYSLWKLKHKLPYQKVMMMVMQRILKGMAKNRQHEEYLEQCNVKLTIALEEFEKSLHFKSLQLKYGKLFKIENYRSELRAKVKQLTAEKKTELWQNIVDEVILFVFFFIVITRQTVTMNMIQKTLLAKYNDDFMNIIGIKKENAANFHLLDQILSQYSQSHIDDSVNDTLRFLQTNLKHDIKPTTDMNFFDIQKQLMSIFQNTVFTKITHKQDINSSTSSHLTNSIDRPVEKIFFAPHDPSYEKASIITRSIEFVRSIGKSVLPNMFPEEKTLLSTQNRYEILNILFNSQQQESVAEMNSNKIISSVFKHTIRGGNSKNNQNTYNNDEDYDNEEEEDEEEEQIEERKERNIRRNNNNNNEKVIDLRKVKENDQLLQSSITQMSDEITSVKIEQAKAFCSLIIKEFRDILDMTSLHNFFYYSCHFELRKFLNRLLLVLQKKNELNKVQSFALFSKFFDKLIVEEFLSSNAEQNNEGFYQVRIKKCIVLTKNVKNSNSNNQSNTNTNNTINNNQNNNNNNTQNNNDDNSHSTDAMSNPNSSEQNLVSSGENQLMHSMQDNIAEGEAAAAAEVDTVEHLINLNILQEIEQFYIVEDSLQELIKRIYYEREQTTVPIEIQKQSINHNEDHQSSDGLSGLMSLLSDGNNSGASGQASLMSLLSKI